MLQASDLQSPTTLAQALDAFALRREKVLAELDVRGARAARRLAGRCKLLARLKGTQLVGDAWTTEWRAVRDAATALIERGEAVLHAPDEPPPSDRPTPVIPARAMADTEPQARAVDLDEVRIALGFVPDRLAR